MADLERDLGGNVQEALAAWCDVEQRSGRWWVDVNVVLSGGAVRKSVADFHDERRAAQAARIIERNLLRSLSSAPDYNSVGVPRPAADTQGER